MTQMLSPHASAVGQHECCSSLAYVGAWPSVSGKVNLYTLPSAWPEMIAVPLLLAARDITQLLSGCWYMLYVLLALSMPSLTLPSAKPNTTSL